MVNFKRIRRVVIIGYEIHEVHQSIKDKKEQSIFDEKDKEFANSTTIFVPPHHKRPPHRRKEIYEKNTTVITYSLKTEISLG